MLRKLLNDEKEEVLQQYLSKQKNSYSSLQNTRMIL